MNEDNKFKPRTANHGNVDGDIALLRDTFLSAEMDYFKELLKSEENLYVLKNLLDFPPDTLYEEAMYRISLIEMGLIRENELSTKEAEISFLLAAIQDKARILELVKTMDIDKENGRSK